MMPAKRPEEGAGESVLDAMIAYASYGFSVIPIMPKSKRPFGAVLPEGKWRKYQQTRATREEIQGWCNQRPDTGVGIVCGEVSGGLYCLDIDDPEFSLYVEAEWANTLEGRGVWIERSGSGKLHLFVRSTEPLLTSVVVGGGRHLADIRGDGSGNHGPSYMVVAPTIHPDTHEPYTLYAGHPEHVGTIKSAAELFDIIRTGFTGAANPNLIVRPDEGYDTTDQNILAYDQTGWEALQGEINREYRFSRKVKLAMLEGAQAGEGKWSTAPSNSEIDHAVIREMRLLGWDAGKIEQVFAWGPMGNHRYRSTKGTRGRGYVLGSLNKIDQEEANAREASRHAEGTNFRIDKVIRIGYEEPVFELHVTVTTPPQRKGVARMEVDDLMDEHRFARSLGKSLNFFPIVDRSLEGRKFRKFGSLVLAMAQEESVPQSATVGGHLRATIMAFIVDETSTFVPEDHRQVTLGWRNNGAAYIRGGALLQRLQNIMHPKPKPEDVWKTLRGMGAEEVGHRWPQGRTEAVWTVPVTRTEYSSEQSPEST